MAVNFYKFVGFFAIHENEALNDIIMQFSLLVIDNRKKKIPSLHEKICE